jgi:hypothetical protein
MFACKLCSTPVDTQSKLFDDDEPLINDVKAYWSLIGALQYLTFSWPDITYIVQQVCFHMYTSQRPTSLLSSEFSTTSVAPSTT